MAVATVDGSQIDDRLETLGRRLRLMPFRRRRILREARDHLLEEVERQVAAGVPRAAAESIAVERFGDVDAIVEAELRTTRWVGARVLLAIDRRAAGRTG